MDLEPFAAIGEYKGQEITQVEGHIREQAYKQTHGEHVAMSFIGNHISFDGYKTAGGNDIEISENPGTWLNHSKFHANCKPVCVRMEAGLRMVMMTKRAIAAKEELTWNYGNTRKNLEPFMYQ